MRHFTDIILTIVREFCLKAYIYNGIRKDAACSDIL